MCLNCGCMRAHDDMGKPDINITYEDLKRAAADNDMTVEATLEIIAKTGEQAARASPNGIRPPRRCRLAAPVAPGEGDRSGN